jgi:hypothetical protein
MRNDVDCGTDSTIIEVGEGFSHYSIRSQIRSSKAVPALSTISCDDRCDDSECEMPGVG